MPNPCTCIESVRKALILGWNRHVAVLGDRQLADKWLMYDASIRVPLIIFDPRVSNPSVVDEMVLNIDVTKSILEFAGVGRHSCGCWRNWRG